VPDYLNNGTQGQSSRRSGDHHDGMHFLFGSPLVRLRLVE
jgi:hypothetical protein